MLTANFHLESQHFHTRKGLVADEDLCIMTKRRSLTFITPLRAGGGFDTYFTVHTDSTPYFWIGYFKGEERVKRLTPTPKK